MDIKIKKITALDTPLPKYATDCSSGLDLYASVERRIFLMPNEHCLIPCGYAFEIPEGYEGQVRPRSGLSGKGLISILGTVDSDYRGEVGIRLWNFSFSSQIIEPMDRIAQLVICPVVRVSLVLSNELSGSIRGTKGFGSTGR